MPIANCIVSKNLIAECENVTDILDLWRRYSGKASEHMTVNLIDNTRQIGREYAVMAMLHLPSLWSDGDVRLLQTSLAKALSECFKISLDDVIVMTQIIDSGHVVESGKVLDWN